jgi:oxygen-independent coproporphyrinogen-3 oxidase
MQVDREYVEIYPLNWKRLDEESVRQILTERSEPSLSGFCIYVHVPFCPVICPFCAFNKRLFKVELYEQYIRALLAELRLYYGHPDAANRPVQAVYFGGGTGSMLYPEHVALILKEIRQNFEVLQSAQVTMECYPTTISKSKLAAYRVAGINRVSIGLQTFDECFLTLVHRENTIGVLEEVCHATHDVGFDNLRVDLMYRLPNQTISQLRSDLDKFVALEPDGISTYSLELTGIPFERVVPALPDDGLDREMFYFIGDYLAQHGYHRFAQPDFCRPGCEDRYVLNAWAAPQGLLLGLGAGAQTHHFGGHVYANVCSVERYIAGLENGRFPGTVGARLESIELQHKYMVLGVRCLRIEKDRFREIFGRRIDRVFNRELGLAMEHGWLSDDGETYSVTQEGLWYVDNLSKVFYSHANLGGNQPRGKQLAQYEDLPLVVIGGRDEGLSNHR